MDLLVGYGKIIDEEVLIFDRSSIEEVEHPPRARIIVYVNCLLPLLWQLFPHQEPVLYAPDVAIIGDVKDLSPYKEDFRQMRFIRFLAATLPEDIDPTIPIYVNDPLLREKLRTLHPKRLFLSSRETNGLIHRAIALLQQGEVKEIGKGDNGVVYRLSIDKHDYALKIIEWTRNNKSPILDEIKALSILRSHDRAILSLIDYHVNDDHVCILTEYLEGYVSLGDIIDGHITFRVKRPDVKRFCQLIRHLIRGINTIHRFGLVHGDLGIEANILIHPKSMDAKFIDFGWATFKEEKYVRVDGKHILPQDDIEELADRIEDLSGVFFEVMDKESFPKEVTDLIAPLRDKNCVRERIGNLPC